MNKLQLEELQGVVLSLCDIFKCVVCTEVLQPDTLSCVKGHCICATCKGQRETCPSCESGFSNVEHNSIVRKVLEVIPHPCRYKKCSYVVTSGDDHETYCSYRPTQCRTCEWEGATVGLTDHMKESHPEKVVFLEKTQPILTVCQDLDTRLSVKSQFLVYGHFLWQVEELDPPAAVGLTDHVKESHPEKVVFLEKTQPILTVCQDLDTRLSVTSQFLVYGHFLWQVEELDPPAAVGLTDHVKESHPEKVVFLEKTQPILTVCQDLDTRLSVTSQFLVYGHFLWQVEELDPPAAVGLTDHVKESHPEKVVFLEKTQPILTVCQDLDTRLSVTSQFLVYGHFLWQVEELDPPAGVLRFTFLPVFCGKPTHDVYVKVTFKADRIRMEAGVDPGENCLLVPVAVLRHFYNKETRELTYSVFVTKSRRHVGRQ